MQKSDVGRELQQAVDRAYRQCVWIGWCRFQDGDLGQVRKEQASTRQLAIFGIERSNAAANPHRCVDQTAVVPACFLYRGGPDRAVAHRHVERHILSLRYGRMHQTLYFDPLPIVRPGQQASEAHPGSGYR
jgi:hypothetical protein